MSSAVGQSLTQAARQGRIVVETVSDRNVWSEGGTGSILDRENFLDELAAKADPETASDIEDMAAQQQVTWVAMMINTCEYCLPLHGKTMSRAEWQEAGLDPETIHADKGWASPCWCSLIPEDGIIGGITPLVRLRDEKGSSRTRRGVSQSDIDRSQIAAAKAMESKQGRRVMRLLGQSAYADENE